MITFAASAMLSLFVSCTSCIVILGYLAKGVARCHGVLWCTEHALNADTFCTNDYELGLPSA